MVGEVKARFACEACHNVKKRCSQPGDGDGGHRPAGGGPASRCKRCARLGLECLPRVVLRGRAANRKRAGTLSPSTLSTSIPRKPSLVAPGMATPLPARRQALPTAPLGRTLNLSGGVGEPNLHAQAPAGAGPGGLGPSGGGGGGGGGGGYLGGNNAGGLAGGHPQVKGAVATITSNILAKARAQQASQTAPILRFAIGNQDMAATYHSASKWVELFHTLGIKQAPPFLHWLLKTLALGALSTNSTERLHAACALALRTGTRLDVGLLTNTPIAVDQAELAALERIVDDRFMTGEEAGACFIQRTVCGERRVKTNAAFEDLFCSGQDIATHHMTKRSCPHQELWQAFVLDGRQTCDNFLTKIARTSLVAEPQGSPARILWTCQSDHQVTIQDRFGRRYRGYLYEAGLAANEGLVFFLIFGFKRLELLDPPPVPVPNPYQDDLFVEDLDLVGEAFTPVTADLDFGLQKGDDLDFGFDFDS